MGRLKSIVFGIALSALATITAPGVPFHEQVAFAHPLHTSLAELSYDERSGMLEVSLRVFVDDFTEASLEWGKTARVTGRRTMVGYALEMFTVTVAGQPVVFGSCGGKHVGDLMWLCFRSRVAPPAPGSIAVSSRILFGKYKDQINVVQAAMGGTKTNLLFTPGDGPKKVR